MGKIAFVGDVHLTCISPSSRKEDNAQYRELLLSKIQNILDICKRDSISNVIILGDLFNNNSAINNRFETEIWSKLLSFKEENINLYTIVGNHDQLFQNDTEFKGTYLYKAFLAGIIKHLDTLDIDGVRVTGVDFGKDFEEQKYTCKYSICVAHCFYENEMFGGTGNGNLTDEECINLHYNAYVLGHDHSPYQPVEKPKYKVIRPGSITRGTSKTCNLYRKVNIAVFDTDTLEFSEEEITTKPGKEVFNEKVVISKDLDINLENLLENFSASKGLNIYDIIEDNKSNGRKILKEHYDEVENLIVQYLESNGIYKVIKDEN